MSNHISFSDPITLIAILPWFDGFGSCRFMLKEVVCLMDSFSLYSYNVDIHYSTYSTDVAFIV